MHIDSVKPLNFFFLRIGYRMVCETGLLKQTYPDERNNPVSCTLPDLGNYQVGGGWGWGGELRHDHVLITVNIFR